jgi:NifB/MoaA-like Fe-S oxidoreductase
MWSLLEKEADDAINDCDYKLSSKRNVTLVTGKAAYPLITQIIDKMCKKWDNLNGKVIKIENNFFGPLITVAGLVTATDIIEQLQGVDLGDELIIPDVMLRSEKDMFLDSITVDELSEKLGVKITVTSVDGYDMVESILGGAVWQNL